MIAPVRARPLLATSIAVESLEVSPAPWTAGAVDTFERGTIRAGFWDGVAGDAPPLSRIGSAVLGRLRTHHPAGRGSSWNVSRGNRLAGHDGRPWLVQSPPANAPVRAGHSEFLHDDVFDTIAGAKKRITLATLSTPDKPYLATIRRGLAEAAAKVKPGEPAIDARILLGSVQHPKGEAFALKRVLDEVTRDLSADARIRVSVGTYAGQKDSPWSYSHTKIVSADGDDALVGGHNWWSNEYNVAKSPVYDLSMRVRGPAAAHAEDFFDSLWDYTQGSGTVVTREARDARGAAIPVARPPVADTRAANSKKGPAVISVGTTGGASLRSWGTSDTALYAMIDSAEKSVRISAQDLVSMPIEDKQPVIFGMKLPWKMSIPQHLTPGMLDHLGDALVRGVDVQIGLSSDAAGGYQHGWSPEKTKAAILDHVKARHPRAHHEAIARRLDIRGLYDDTGAPIRNHAKMLAVDDQAFYVGSQNFYPGGMKEVAFTQLAEFGYIVDDAAATRTLLEDYWHPLWRNTEGR